MPISGEVYEWLDLLKGNATLQGPGSAELMAPPNALVLSKSARSRDCFFRGRSGFRNPVHAGCRYEVQCSGRVGQWSRAVAAIQLDRGSSRTGWDVALCGLDPVLCFPLSIDVCLAVWEQFWCDRAGLVCGSWAFQRVRRRSCRRGPSAGKTYAYPEG